MHFFQPKFLCLFCNLLVKNAMIRYSRDKIDNFSTKGRYTYEKESDYRTIRLAHQSNEIYTVLQTCTEIQDKQKKLMPKTFSPCSS